MSVSSNNFQNQFIEKQYFMYRENIIFDLTGNMKIDISICILTCKMKIYTLIANFAPVCNSRSKQE